MKTRSAEVLVAPGEVVLVIADNDARLAVRLTPDEAQLLAAELASGALQVRDKLKEADRHPLPLHQVR